VSWTTLSASATATRNYYTATGIRIYDAYRLQVVLFRVGGTAGIPPTGRGWLTWYCRATP
jgi:hypothetical protein